MQLKIISLFAAMTVLAACSNHPQQAAVTQSQATPPVVDNGGTVSDQLKAAGDRVYFDFDKSSIAGDAQATLAAQADVIKKFPQATFTLQGNCDERGTREYNLALGERRATATKNALVALGVDASRLKTISYGKERPSVVGHDDAAWSKNRNTITVAN